MIALPQQVEGWRCLKEKKAQSKCDCFIIINEIEMVFSVCLKVSRDSVQKVSKAER